MQYKEIKKEFKNYSDVYVVEDMDMTHQHGWHSDFLKCLNEYEVEDDREVIADEVMTPAEATERVFQNSGTDLSLIYEKEDKILFVKVENGFRYYNK